MSLSSIAEQKLIKLLVYGDSGAGKTCLAASFPGPILICDFDGKASSLANFLGNSEKAKEISVESFVPVDNTGGAADRFNREILGRLSGTKPFPYKTIVVDSLTTFSDEGMNFLIRSNPGIARMKTSVVQVPCMQDYRIARIWFKRVIQGLLTLPCNVIFTAHINVDKDEISGRVIRAPMLAGKLKQELPIYFDEVYRMHVDKGVNLFQTRADANFSIIRSQIPRLPDQVPANYQELIKQR